MITKKLTFLLACAAILCTIHISLGWAILYESFDLIDDCYYLWGYCFLAIMFSAYALASICINILCCLFRSNRDARYLFSFYVLLQLVCLILGSYIYFSISDDCKSSYQDDINGSQLWKFYESSLLYSLIIVAIVAIMTIICWCFCQKGNNSSILGTSSSSDET